MLLLQKGVQLPHGRALTGFRNSIGSSNSSLSTNKSEGQRNPLDCSENHGKRPQFHSSCFQTGPEKILLSTPQVSFRASFSGGQTRSPVSTFQQANAMRSQTDDVAKAPLTFIRLRKRCHGTGHGVPPLPLQILKNSWHMRGSQALILA